MTSLIISNEDMNDIIKIVKSHEESGLLMKVVNETVKKEAEEQKGGFLGMLLGTYGARFLGNLLISKGVKAKILGRGVIRAGTIRDSEASIRTGEGTIRAGQDF